MGELEADMASAAEQLSTYDTLLANGMTEKVLWLIDHPCGIKQLRKLAADNYHR